jgi:two-component system response regulator
MTEKSILLVDDDLNDVALTMRALKSGNISSEIKVVGDGVEALDYLHGTGSHAGRDASALPAVVLLDIKLPKLNGIEVLQRLRSDERTKMLPVVILTSSNEERDIIDGYSFGANSYVRKPVNFDEFTKAVRQLGVYWLLLNERPPVKT